MKKYYYHVVTDKPMELNQIIVFDENHHNGVHDRIMACKNILDGNIIDNDLHRFINENLEYWKIRTYRELALEQVRIEKYPNYPSRLACLYVTQDLENAAIWADTFMKSDRKVLQIVKLEVDGNCFIGDAYNVFDGTTNEKDNIMNAEYYWNNSKNKYNKEPLIEILVDGKIQVVEIIQEYQS